MSEKWKKIKDSCARLALKATVLLNTIVSVGGAPASAGTPSNNSNPDEAKKVYPVDNTHKYFGFERLDECKADRLDMEKLATYLQNKKFTLADVIDSGVISKKQLAEFHYTQEDLQRMGGSPLMKKLKQKLIDNAVKGSQELCTRRVREAWFSVTQENKNKSLGVYSEKQVTEENLWSARGKGDAKYFPETIKEYSSTLVFLGVCKAEENASDKGNVDFDMQNSSGFICVVPGDETHSGHTFYCENGEQYSDFTGGGEWIFEKMRQGYYLKEFNLFASLDALAPYSLIKAVLEAQKGVNAKDLCERYGVNYTDYLTSVFPLGYYDYTNPTERIAYVLDRKEDNNKKKDELNSLLNEDTSNEKKAVAQSKNTSEISNSVKTDNQKNQGRV